jgi:prevent-host-death family protein
MKSTYTIKEAQQDIAKMVRSVETGRLVTITRHEKPVAYVISPERFKEILETMEILADPEAVKAIRDAQASKTKFIDLEDLPD